MESSFNRTTKHLSCDRKRLWLAYVCREIVVPKIAIKCTDWLFKGYEYFDMVQYCAQFTHVRSAFLTKRFPGDPSPHSNQSWAHLADLLKMIQDQPLTHKQHKIRNMTQNCLILESIILVTVCSCTWDSICCSPSSSLSPSGSLGEMQDLITMSSLHSVSDVLGDSARSRNSSRLWPRNRILSRRFSMVTRLWSLTEDDECLSRQNKEEK